MLIYITSRVISSTVAFLYPGYASYKTLSQRPASEADLERWLMYWSVLGCIVGVEYVAEWLISWLPLYYPMKTVFLLYLSLPQTRGSSYLYANYLQPFLHQHEHEIDATLFKLKSRVYTFLQNKLRMVWEQIMASLGRPVQPGASAAADTAPPPTMADPASGPLQLLGGLWRAYGPSVVASGASLFAAASVAAAAPQRAQPVSSAQTQGQGHGRSVSQTLLERRRQLEAELASLPPSEELHNYSSGSDSEPPPQLANTIPVQHGASAYVRTSPTGSDADLRARVGQFEEVEVPSDVEGYDIGAAPRRGPAEAPPKIARRTSWFSWGSAAGPDKGTKDD